MVKSDVEIKQEKESSRQVKRQPVRVRLLGALFGVLVVCDLMVLGIMLDWPAKIAPAAAQSAWIRAANLLQPEGDFQSGRGCGPGNGVQRLSSAGIDPDTRSQYRATAGSCADPGR